MDAKFFCLSKEDSQDPEKCGLKYAISKKGEWKPCPVSDMLAQINQYQSATSYIVIDNIAYTIFKDYIILSENTRLYILKDRNLDTDRLS